MNKSLNEYFELNFEFNMALNISKRYSMIEWVIKIYHPGLREAIAKKKQSFLKKNCKRGGGGRGVSTGFHISYSEMLKLENAIFWAWTESIGVNNNMGPYLGTWVPI